MNFDWLIRLIECSNVSTTNFILQNVKFWGSLGMYMDLSAIVLSLSIPGIGTIPVKSKVIVLTYNFTSLRRLHSINKWSELTFHTHFIIIAKFRTIMYVHIIVLCSFKLKGYIKHLKSL